ncbi:MAG TPA: flagellar motor switch protein FliN [Armatimonadetes bacterium]|nr:flagellar motor switch protein FliN [Armatimonadota bacterium]
MPAAQPGFPAPKASDPGSLELLLDIPLEISVELGRVKMLVKDVVELGTGSIIEIDKAAGEPVDVLVNGRLVARGEVVVIEDNFGVRITEILTPQERLTKLGEVA